MKFTIETELEEDGRWIAEVLEIPRTLVYRDTKQEAISKVQALGLRVIADRLEHGEEISPQRQRRNWPRMVARIAKSTGLSPDDL